MKTLKRVLIYLLLALYVYLCFLMVTISLQYYSLDTDVAFLRIKQDYIHLLYYKVAFFIHVFTSLLVLVAGLTQFSNKLRSKSPRVHRGAGWLYVIIVVLLSGPTGFIIGVHANGGFSSQIAFCMLAILWIYFTVKAAAKARRGYYVEHRKYMIRSFALALSALTLRGWKVIIVAVFEPRPMDVYQIVAWLGWVLNLIIAEIIIRKKFKA